MLHLTCDMAIQAFKYVCPYNKEFSMKKFAIIVTLILASNSWAEPTFGGAKGLIKSITIKETGYLLIAFEAAHANTTECLKNDYVAIANNNPNREMMLSISLAANAQKKLANYWVVSCYEAYGTSYPLAITATIM